MHDSGRHWARTRFGRYMDLVGCVLVLLAVVRGAPWPASSSLRALSPQALILLGGAGFIAWRPFLGECRWRLRHFWSRRATALHPDLPKKKALCYTRLVGGTYDKYRLGTCLEALYQTFLTKIKEKSLIFR